MQIEHLMQQIRRFASTMKEPLAVCLAIVTNFLLAQGCNESNCAPVVSMCLLTRSCNCDVQNETCYASCHACLGKDFIECCSCVDVCPSKMDYEPDKLSTVEDLDGPIPELFKALLEIDDTKHWSTETYENYYTNSKGNLMNTNCSVIWWNNCMSFRKCKQSCNSVGANSLRLFHNGCCECVGEKCINYGRSKSLCTACPRPDNEEEEYAIEDDDNDLEMDYGEDFEEE
ncbi:unnamed protein product [Phyllotreta striolata]|uniref:Protein twisted gastrulation n=1 Tax=Phyllotreta striolata TaxID=444603 RepID=A0A9N9TLL2_PHYSR|nr:unnamed protein product [Phyllotreta striolata]